MRRVQSSSITIGPRETFVYKIICLIAMLTPSTSLADQSPAILQITIERIHAGSEARYSELEERMVETCRRLECPNSYLALESLAAPKEVWLLVEYATDAEVQRVRQAYEQNPPLLAALADLAALKKDITDAPVEHMTKHRADLSVAAPWQVGSEPFVAIATQAATGSVFEGTEHAMFTVVSAASLLEANAVAATLGPSARVFRVQPSWSRPAELWVAANPELWQRH
jgi:hypothetical protein